MNWFKKLTLPKKYTLVFLGGIYIPLIIGVLFAFRAGQGAQKKFSLEIYKKKEDSETEKLKAQFERLISEITLIPTFGEINEIISSLEQNPKMDFSKKMDLPKVKSNLKILEKRFELIIKSNRNLWGISFNTKIGSEFFNIIAMDQNQETHEITIRKNINLKQLSPDYLEIIQKTIDQLPNESLASVEKNIIFPFNKKLSHFLDSIYFYKGVSKSPKKSEFYLTFYQNPFSNLKKFKLEDYLSKTKYFKIILRENKEKGIEDFAKQADNTEQILKFLNQLPKNFLEKNSSEIIDNDLNVHTIRKIPLKIFGLEKLVLISFYPGTTFHGPIREARNNLIKLLGFCMVLVIPLLYFTLKKITKELYLITLELKKTGQTMEKSTEVIQNTSSSIRKIDGENKESLTAINSKMEEMIQSSTDSMIKNNEMSSLSKQTDSSAKEGRNDLNEMAISMEKIIESSKNISKIVDIIENIAMQTNILSMNASVEAARAGEHGRGFAVVAEAIRNLAQKSSQSASDIGKLIQESIEISEKGASKAAQNQMKFKGMIENIEKLNSHVGESTELLEKRIKEIEIFEKEIRKITNGISKGSLEIEKNEIIAKELFNESNVLKNSINKILGMMQGKNS